MCNAGNHRDIVTEAGYTDVKQYRYYDKKSRGLDYKGLIQDLKVIWWSECKEQHSTMKVFAI